MSFAADDDDDDEMSMEVDQVIHHQPKPEADVPAIDVTPDYSAAKTGLTCLPQRAALLKSMLNFLKKAIQVCDDITIIQCDQKKLAIFAKMDQSNLIIKLF